MKTGWLQLVALASAIGVSCGGQGVDGGPQGASGSGGMSASGGKGPGPSTGGIVTSSGGDRSDASGGATGGSVVIQSGGSAGSDALGGQGGESTFCCQALPSCDHGDSEIAVDETCPEGKTCYRRSLCCSEIQCIREGSACQSDAPLNKKYFGDSESCKVIKFTCPEHTEMFTDDCGCGCEQDAGCPPTMNCQSGLQQDARCASNICPYTTRLY